MSWQERSDWLKSFGVAVVVNATALAALSLVVGVAPAPAARTEIIVEAPDFGRAVEAAPSASASPADAARERAAVVAPDAESGRVDLRRDAEEARRADTVQDLDVVDDNAGRIGGSDLAYAAAADTATGDVAARAAPGDAATPAGDPASAVRVGDGSGKAQAVVDTDSAALAAADGAVATVAPVDQVSALGAAAPQEVHSVPAQTEAAAVVDTALAADAAADGTQAAAASADQFAAVVVAASRDTYLAPTETEAAAVAAIAPPVDTAGRVGAAANAPQSIAPPLEAAPSSAPASQPPAPSAAPPPASPPPVAARVAATAPARVAAQPADGVSGQPAQTVAPAQTVRSSPAAPVPAPTETITARSRDDEPPSDPQAAPEPPSPAEEPQQEVAALPRPAEPAPPQPGAKRISFSLVADIMRRHGGGTCSVVLSGRDEKGRFGFAAYGLDDRETAPFRAAFARETGIVPPMRSIAITPEQCLAVAFVRSAEKYPAFRLAIALDRPVVESGAPVSGRIANVDGKHLLLLVVDDEGLVQPVAVFGPGRAEASFSAPMTLTGDAVDTAQLLVAIATDVSLADAAPKGGEKADAFFLSLNDRLALAGIAPDMALAPFAVH